MRAPIALASIVGAGLPSAWSPAPDGRSGVHRSPRHLPPPRRHDVPERDAATAPRHQGELSPARGPSPRRQRSPRRTVDGIPHHSHTVLAHPTVARSLGHPYSASVLTAVVLVAAVLGAVVIAVVTVVA